MKTAKTKVSITTLIICCFFASAGSLLIAKIIRKNNPVNAPVEKNECAEKMDQTRLKNFKYIQPLILADIHTESSSLKTMRFKIEEYINLIKSSHKANEISVYFRSLNNGSWFSINPNVSYNPASMSKIIYLITFLKEAETNPAVFDKQIYFKHHFRELSVRNFNETPLKEYSSYSVKDLLVYMLKYSDNDAAVLLSQNMNLNIYSQLFNDLGETCPIDYGEYYITPVQFSKFFRLLYNASYIRPDLSEYGLKLLSDTDFPNGISAGIDPLIRISHKYGERVTENEAQLHEFGIIYFNNDPYLLGVMTKGSTLNELTGILKEISRLSYLEFSKLHNS